jgi:hypothetical protein
MERVERAITAKTEANLARLAEDRDRSIKEAERIVAGPSEQRAQATQRLLEAQEQASQTIAHAENYVAMLTEGAKEEADAILEEANQKARLAMDKAIEQAEEHRKAAQEQIDRLKVQRSQLDNYLARLRRLLSRDLARRAQ